MEARSLRACKTGEGADEALHERDVDTVGEQRAMTSHDSRMVRVCPGEDSHRPARSELLRTAPS